MAGITDLLGKIVGGIGKVADHPMVQGLGAAAAFGANPLVGLLAAGGIQRSRDSRALENDISREQLQAMRRTNDLNEELGGLFDSRTQTSLGAPQVPGLQQQPLSLLEGLERRPSVPTVQTPEGQMKLQSLLTQLSPAAAAQAQFSNQTRNPTALEQKFAAFNQLFPGGKVPENPTPGQLAQMSMLGIDNNNLDETLARFELEKSIWEMQQARTETERKEQEVGIQKAEIKDATMRSFNELSEMARLNDIIANSPLLGNPAVMEAVGSGNVAAIVELAGRFGIDTREAEQVAKAMVRFDQLATQLAITRLSGPAAELAGTDAKFRTYRETKPSTALGPTANALTIADTIEDSLSFAENRGYDVVQRETLLELAKSLRDRYSIGSLLNPTATFESTPNPFEGGNGRGLPFNPATTRPVSN